MEPGADEVPEDAGAELRAAEEPKPEEAAEKQIYLRTVYPLNPGIPHFVDVPGGW